MATYDLTSSTPSKIQTGDIINCPYSGTYKQITLPKGTYKLEVWGAQGGEGSTSSSSIYVGGYGGYSVGTLILTETKQLYIYAGGSGTRAINNTSSSTLSNIGGFNGGGDCYGWSNDYRQGSGGGASDIRIGQNSLYARVIVAGGGGGAAFGNGGTNQASTYAYGGGVSGANGYASGYSSGNGATQTSGNSFGIGGNGANGKCSGGGGGGWYGGYGSSDYGCGGGGSGYVYTSSTASSYPSGCLLNSSYYLTNASTTAGNASFTSPSGSSETGHTGNGYCRITVVDTVAATKMYIKINGEWMELF